MHTLTTRPAYVEAPKWKSQVGGYLLPPPGVLRRWLPDWLSVSCCLTIGRRSITPIPVGLPSNVEGFTHAECTTSTTTILLPMTSAATSWSAYADWFEALPTEPIEVARIVLGHTTVAQTWHQVLQAAAQAVLTEPRPTASTEGDAATDATLGRLAAAMIPALKRLQQHGDPSLLESVCGKQGWVDVAILATTYGLSDEATPLLTAAWPRTEVTVWWDMAWEALKHATNRFFYVPWAEGIQRLRRAARLADALLQTHPVIPTSSEANCRESLTNIAQALAEAYHGVLAASRIPRDEASSSATPWPSAWLAAKVDVLSTADACVMAAHALGDTASPLAALDEQALHIPDSVALVDAPLRTDLQNAAPACASILGTSMTPFPGAAWAAVRPLAAVTVTAPPVNTELVDMILGVLPHLDRQQVESRVARPRYQDMTPEAVLEVFLDDPDGLQDLDDDYDPVAGMASMRVQDDAPLSDDLKAAILARAEAEDTLEEEWDLNAPPTPTQQAERLLLATYQSQGAGLFARTKVARQSAGRARLREMLAPLGTWGDDQIEGWAVMLERHPNREAMLMRAQHMITPNTNVGKERSWGADKMRGGRIPSQRPSGHGGGRGGHRGGQRGGGRGGGRGGHRGGPRGK